MTQPTSRQFVRRAAQQRLDELNQLLTTIQRQRAEARRQWERTDAETRARWEMLVTERNSLRAALGEEA